MPAVLRINNAIAHNPNLLTLAGVDPDKRFGEIWIDLGQVDSDLAGWEKVPLVLASSQGSEIVAQKLSNAAGLKTAVNISSNANFRSFTSGTELSVSYPANVGSDGFYIGETSGIDFLDAEIYLDGLSKKRLYTIELFASRIAADSKSRTGFYEANLRNGTLDANNNDSDVLRLVNIAADTSGRITLRIERRTSDFAYINAIKLIEQESI